MCGGNPDQSFKTSFSFALETHKFTKSNFCRVVDLISKDHIMPIIAVIVCVCAYIVYEVQFQKTVGCLERCFRELTGAFFLF